MVRIEHFELRTPDVVALRLPAGAVVRVSTGRLWLTQDGRSEDVWLQAHGSWTAPQAVSVRLSAEPSVDFQIALTKLVDKQAKAKLFIQRWSVDYSGVARYSLSFKWEV